MTLRFRIAILLASAVLSATPVSACAQAPALPDSVAAQMLSPGLFRLLDYQIASAALGRKHVLVLELPRGPHWSRVGAHILQVLNGRVATKADSSVLAIGIRGIRLSGDTVIASMFEESRQLCEDGKWMHSGTDYEARTRRVRGGGWTRLEIHPGMTWDGWCMPTPGEEVKQSALASDAAGLRPGFHWFR